MNVQKMENSVRAINELAFFRVRSNDKRPDTPKGYHDAKVNFDIAGTLAQGYNIGFVMEPNGLITIDMDEDSVRGYEGIKVIQNLEKELGTLPQTYTQKTPRGGLHKVFLSKGLQCKPRGKITPAVDVKYAGYILFHGSCINGRYYQAIDGVTKNGELIFSALPQNWLEYISTDSKLKNTDKKSLSTNYEPVVIDGNFKNMYENCQFVRECVDFETSSILSEPEWHMFARLLNSFSNGEELFDRCSKNYPNYDPCATKRKFLYAKKYPVNCLLISEVSDACKNCNNKFL